MTPQIQAAIEDLRTRFPESTIIETPDGEGGAYVIVEGVNPGPLYCQGSVWIGFRITFQYPYADVYPHFIDGALSRRDGKPLGAGLAPTQPFQNRSAIQISRRTNHPDPRFETAARKLERVLHWLATRP